MQQTDQHGYGLDNAAAVLRADLSSGVARAAAAINARLAPRPPRELPHDLADAIRTARQVPDLGWSGLGIAGHPGRGGDGSAAVTAPGRDVHVGVPDAQRALAEWQQGRGAATRLAALARSLVSPDDEDAARSIDAAERALRAVPEPPGSVPPAPEARAAAWRDLAQFRSAASGVGRAAAEIVSRAVADWHERYQKELGPGRHIRAGLPRLLPPDLADPLRALDEAERALPRPPGTLSATAAGVLDDLRPIADGLDLLPGVAALRRAQDDLLKAATEKQGWNARRARATELAAAARALIPNTGAEAEEHEQALGNAEADLPPAAPAADAPREQVQAALRTLAALEAATRGVLRDATSRRGLQQRVAGAAQTVQAAQNLLPLTGDQEQGLTERLEAAVSKLNAARPAWWKDRPDLLETPADIKAVKAGLDAREEEPLDEAMDKLREVVGDITNASERTSERAGGISRVIRDLLRHAGPQRHALERDLRRAEAAVPRHVSGRTAPRAVQRAEMWRQVLTAASTELAARASAATSLGERARELLRDTGIGQDDLAMRLESALRSVRDLAVRDLPMDSAEEIERTAQDLLRAAREVVILEGQNQIIVTRAITNPSDLAVKIFKRRETEAGRLLPHAGPQREALQGRFDRDQAAGQALLARQPGPPGNAADLSQARIWRDEFMSVDASLTQVVVGALAADAAGRLARAADDMVPSIQALIPHLDGQQAKEAKEFTDAEGALRPSDITLPEPGDLGTGAYLNASFVALAPFAELEAAAERLLAAAGRRARDDTAAARDLAAAAQQLPDQDPEAAATLTDRLSELDALGELPAEPSLTAADAPGVVTRLERIAGLREATRTVLTAVAAPLDLGARARALADPVRPLLRQLVQRADTLRGELDAADRQAAALRGDQDAAVRRADTSQAELEAADQPTDTWRAALALSARHADAVMANVADDLADRVRDQLDAAVRRADTLERELNAAVQQLDAIRPAYQGADQATAAQVDALRTVLKDRERLEQTEQAGGRLATAVQAIVAAAVDELPRTADSQLALALRMSVGMRLSGRDALADALIQARGDVTALVAEELRAPGVLATQELAATITAMAPMTRLTTAMADEMTALSDWTRPRVDRLRRAAQAVEELTLQVPVPDRVRESFRQARNRLGALAELPARPPATSPSFDAAFEAEATASRLEAAMPDVLTEALAGIEQRGRAAEDLAQAVCDLVSDNRAAVPGADGLIRELGDALDRVSATEAAIGHEQPSRDPAQLAGQVQAAASAHEAVTALKEITELALASATANLAQQVETARELAGALPGLLPFTRPAQQPALRRQLDDASQAVRNLPVPQPRPGAADAAVTWVADVSGALEAVTALMTVARSVAGSAAQPLDALRPEAAVAADVARTARALPAARQDADMAARLDGAVQALESRQPIWWPARAADLTTARQAAGVVQAVEQRDRLVRDVQADIWTALDAAGATLTLAATDVKKLAEAARGLLRSPGEQDTLNDLIARARQLAARPASPSALGTLAAAVAAGRDLERLASLQAAVNDLIGAAGTRLAERLRGSADLGRAAMNLLDQAHRPDHPLRAAVANATFDAGEAYANLPGSLITRAHVATAVAALNRVTTLEDLARRVLTEATDPVVRAWQSVTDARRLAQVVRTLAPPAGDLARVPAAAAAVATADAALGRLYQMLPDWWEQRSGADVSAALLRSVGASLDADLTGQMERADADLQYSVRGLHDAARDWWEAQRSTAARLVRDERRELPNTGSARDELTPGGRARRRPDPQPDPARPGPPGPDRVGASSPLGSGAVGGARGTRRGHQQGRRPSARGIRADRDGRPGRGDG